LAALGRQPDWLDLFAADEGRFADLAEQVTWVRSRAADQLASGDTARASANRGIADLMEAHGLMRQGAPEAAVALLEPIDPANAFFRALRRWWLGELYLELGQADNALSYLATGWEGGWTPIVLSRFRAGQAYEMLGRDEEAMTAYSEFIEFWNGADPELQPVVEDARARIAQLQLPD
jgi:predicted negative regulator of RcsB-dependent stress response